jgi:O-antigen/teichoic acid export membrane protein
MGVAGLLHAGTGIIAGFTNLGLSNGAVKIISGAISQGDDVKIGVVITVFKKLVWLSGLLGLFVSLMFSRFLSQISFGNGNYTWSFAVLSITLLINQLSNGHTVLLQIRREIKLLAKTSIVGSVFGLLLTVPIYYHLGINGIVPAAIIVSLTTLISSWYFSSTLKFRKSIINFSDIHSFGNKMVSLGFIISLSTLVASVFSYVIRSFISSYGSIEDVGQYNAGFSILNIYVGMIFTAMSTDYFPKLSSLSHEVEEFKLSINQQGEIAILVLSPIILTIMIFIKSIIYIIYSDEFYVINKMILFASVGILFKAISWAIAYSFLAKGANKKFFWNELISNTYMLIFNLLGYYYFGLSGLGFAFTFAYVLYSVQVIFISKRMFNYEMSKDFKNVFIINLILSVLCLLVNLYIVHDAYRYCVGVILLVLSVAFNIINLKRLLISS